MFPWNICSSQHIILHMSRHLNDIPLQDIFCPGLYGDMPRSAIDLFLLNIHVCNYCEGISLFSCRPYLDIHRQAFNELQFSSESLKIEFAYHAHFLIVCWRIGVLSLSLPNPRKISGSIKFSFFCILKSGFKTVQHYNFVIVLFT